MAKRVWWNDVEWQNSVGSILLETMNPLDLPKIRHGYLIGIATIILVLLVVSLPATTLRKQFNGLRLLDELNHTV